MSVSIQASIEKEINFAAAFMGLQPLIHRVVICGSGEGEMVCRITADPEFFSGYNCSVTAGEGSEAELEAPDLRLNPAVCPSDRTKPQKATVTIEVCGADDQERILGRLDTEVVLQPGLYWDEKRYPESLAGFLQPEHPFVQQIAKQAADLVRAGGQPAEGYRSGNVRQQAECLFRVLREREAEKGTSDAVIQLPGRLLENRQGRGAAVDLAVLYASCLEAAGLNPIIAATPNYVLTGVWMSNVAFSEDLIRPAQMEWEIWKNLPEGMLLMDASALADSSPVSFSQAAGAAKERFADCEYLIDVAAARGKNRTSIFHNEEDSAGPMPAAQPGAEPGPDTAEHPIAAALLRGAVTWNHSVTAPKAEPPDCYLLPADRSQEEAIQGAFDQVCQVVLGPKGSRKKQTIVNSMLEAVRRGENVLFVSDSEADLQEVSQRAAAALDPRFLLRLSGDKASHARVLRQVRKTIRSLDRPLKAARAGTGITDRKYHAVWEKLLKYYSLLGRPEDTCGFSLSDLIELSLKCENAPFSIDLEEKSAAVPLKELIADGFRYLAAAKEYEAAGSPYAAYLRDDCSESEKREAVQLAETMLERYEQLSKSSGELVKLLRGPDDVPLDQVIRAALTLQRCKVYGQRKEEILNPEGRMDKAFSKNLVKTAKQFRSAMVKNGSGLQRSYLEHSLQEQLNEIFDTAQTRHWLVQLEQNPKETLEQLSSLRIILTQKGEHRLADSGNEKETLSAYLKQAEANLEGMVPGMKVAVEAAIDCVVEGEGQLQQQRAVLVFQAYKDYHSAQSEAAPVLFRNLDRFHSEFPDVQMITLLRHWMSQNSPEVQRKKQNLLACSDQLKKKGALSLEERIQQAPSIDSVSQADIESCICKAWADLQISRLLSDAAHGNTALLFQQIETVLIPYQEQQREKLRQAVLRQHLERVRQEISEHEGEYNHLQELISKRRLHLSSLLQQSPYMMQKIFPCMMMSAASAEEGLPPFDLVLLKTAPETPLSQVLDFLSKGKRCVLFGEEAQQTPEDDRPPEQQSAIAAALRASVPVKPLKFRYGAAGQAPFVPDGVQMTIPAREERAEPQKQECPPESRTTLLRQSLVRALEQKGYEVRCGIGEGPFTVDLAVLPAKGDQSPAAVLLEQPELYDRPDLIRDRELRFRRELEAKGWKVYLLRALSWYENRERELRNIGKMIEEG